MSLGNSRAFQHIVRLDENFHGKPCGKKLNNLRCFRRIHRFCVGANQIIRQLREFAGVQPVRSETFKNQIVDGFAVIAARFKLGDSHRFEQLY